MSNLFLSPANFNTHKILIQRIAGPNYIFTDEIRTLWSGLFKYFIGSPDSPYDLKKSIALTGQYGVGKSTIFMIVHKWLEKWMIRHPNTYRISSTEEVIATMQENDWLDSVLLHNQQLNVHGCQIPAPIHILVNEFAYMYDVKHYGTNIKELIEMFIMKRYDIFQSYNKLTHVTMNMDVSDLKENFSPRIVDRFREMFNIIEVKGESFRN